MVENQAPNVLVAGTGLGARVLPFQVQPTNRYGAAPTNKSRHYLALAPKRSSGAAAPLQPSAFEVDHAAFGSPLDGREQARDHGRAEVLSKVTWLDEPR